MSPRAQYDDSTGMWLIPVADSNLDLLSEDWSPPVQLKAVQRGDGWELVVRHAEPVTE